MLFGTVSNALPKATELPTDEPSDTSDAWRLCPVGVSGDEAQSHTKSSTNQWPAQARLCLCFHLLS